MRTVPAPTIGRPGDPAAVRSLTLDDVVVTYVVDGVVTTRPQTFFPGTPSSAWQDLCNPGGDLLMSVGGLLVQIGGRRVLIDAGAGIMTSSFPFGRADSGAMLDVLATLGVRPDDIDVLAFTHLHFDHVGSAFTNGARTFPNARYALAAQEWAAYADGLDDEVATTRDVIDQLRCHERDLELFNDGQEIVPGIRALVSPGHTPGHTAYEITSQTDRRLIAFGDAFHSQPQVAQPDWMSIADSDGPGVLAARRRLLARLSESGTAAFGVHFGDQPFGRVVVDAIGQASWQPIPSVVLAPPPQMQLDPAELQPTVTTIGTTSEVSK
jgi:glyoxylase-like metal-dependent hydrolase (beta-lactamase superfamily II)